LLVLTKWNHFYCFYWDDDLKNYMSFMTVSQRMYGGTREVCIVHQ